MMIVSLIKMLRPHQWLKNLLLLFPPFFAGKMTDNQVVSMIVPSVAAFSLAASSAYIINDVRDRKTDLQHDLKRHRAIARGDVSIPVAISIAVSLYVVAFFTASSVSFRFQGFLAIYLLVSLLYTFFLKDVVLVDIFTISTGFLVRVLAGGEAFRIGVSDWLFLTVFIVSLFLAIGKRLGEIVSLGETASRQRRNLAHYQPAFLEGALWFCAAAAVVMYALYVIENKLSLIYTVPVVAFGLLRYVYIVRSGKGDPTEALIKDNQIMITSLVWVLTLGVVIYW